jgi:FkbM family methyltransferase
MRAIFREGAEELVRDFFGGAQRGFYVDVGAADPTLGSQTWHLEQAGWDGIVIEPRPDYAEKLRQHRRAKVYEAACSSPRNVGTKPLHLLAGFSSLRDELVVAGMRPRGSIDVATTTLDQILIDAKAPVPIDFVSIDVEGHELEVLEGFDLARWQPRLLLVEDHLLSLRLHRTLLARGYRWVRRTDLNGWYLPANAATRVGWWGKLQFFRKYYMAMPGRRIRDTVRRVRGALGIWPPRRPV